MRLLLPMILAVTVLAAGAAELLPVWTMNGGFYNDLDGGYNHFASGDSSASIHMNAGVRRGDGGRALQINYRKGASGYCGVWTHLYDERKPGAPVRPIDVSGFAALSFHVKGARGGEDFTIQAADENWLRKEDSSPVGTVSKYLPGGITTNWQEVIVPLKDFWVETDKLGGLTFNFSEPGEGTVYIDDIVFKRAPDTPVPEAAAGAIRAPADRTPARAMWVWETKELLADEAARDAFFAFCAEQKVDELFLQIVYRFATNEAGGEFCEILRPEAHRAFVARCSAAGIKVHALDGYPEFALESQHHKVLAIVRAVIESNKAAAPEERFHGIHLDNEPYQILGFDGPERDSIMLQFFALNRKVMDLLAAEGDGLVYGIDIPNWFDTMDPPCNLAFEGRTQDAASHLIDICDNVGIMDYRTFAYGVDGIIRHGLNEVEHSDRAGKKIYIGVETFRYDPTPVSFIYGMPEAEWRALSSKNPHMLSSTVGDFKVRTMSDGRTRYFGIAHPVPMKSKGAFDHALITLYRKFGAGVVAVEELAGPAQSMIAANPEYDGFEPFALRDKDGKLQAAGFTTTEYMLDKITFAGKSKAEMEGVLAEVADFFRGSPSFAGFAVHYYTTWKAMR